jgi:predicted AAA+ superfamily ATPase
MGTFPNQQRRKRTLEEKEQEMDEKKKAKYDDWKRKKYLMTMNMWDELDMEFPGFIWSSMGQSMKREVMKQANDEFTKPLQGKLNNYIIWGGSGTGKSSSVNLLYPNCYKKQKGSQYWDAYDKTNPDHSTVWIDEMSKETLATLTGKPDGGFEFLKELADRYPVTVDEKYTKGYKIRPKRVIITMNEHPTSLLPERATEVNK